MTGTLYEALHAFTAQTSVTNEFAPSRRPTQFGDAGSRSGSAALRHQSPQAAGRVTIGPTI